MPYKSSTRTFVKVRDSQEDIVQMKTDIGGVRSTIDAVDKSIKDEVWRNTFIEVTDSEGTVIKKRLEDLLVKNTVSLEGIDQSVSSYVADMMNDELLEYNESITKQISDSITETVRNYITGESSYVNQKAGQIEQVIGKTLFEPLKIRYIRDWLYANDKDNENRFVECQAINNQRVNIASGIIPTAYTSDLTEITGIDNLSIYTDDIVETEYIYASDCTVLELDLGDIHTDIETIQIYHYYTDGRKNETKLEISEDGINWITAYDSSINKPYIETQNGYTHFVRMESMADQISFLKQTISSFNITVKENDNKYSIMQGEVSGITTEIKDTKDKVENYARQVSAADGWKLELAKIGAYDDGEKKVETCIEMKPSEGITVSSTDKMGYKTKLQPNQLVGVYDDGISKEETVFSVSDDLTYSKRFKTDTGVDFGNMKIIPVNNYKGRNILAFVKGGGTS